MRLSGAADTGTPLALLLAARTPLSSSSCPLEGLELENLGIEGKPNLIPGTSNFELVETALLIEPAQAKAKSLLLAGAMRSLGAARSKIADW
mmetsp:Transcript_111811/g.209685  ORF Transcript_111811/g.209685 Transcript_111811/m.209685 type:complete len:92 (-) Transcript_111811:143-418(-)